MALEKTLPSISSLVDGALIVDGSYKDYPTPYDLSSDNSVTYIQDQFKGRDCQVLNYPYRMTEVEKRSLYFQYADERLDWKNLWLIVWDGDFELAPMEGCTHEDMVKEFSSLRGRSDINELYFPIDIANQDNPCHSRMVLGFHDMPGLKYGFNHFSIFRGNQEVKGIYPSATFEKTRIIHWHLLKPQHRIDERSWYASFVSRKYEK